MQMMRYCKRFAFCVFLVLAIELDEVEVNDDEAGRRSEGKVLFAC